MEWDDSKKWKEAEAPHLGVNMKSWRKHQAYRVAFAKGRAAWELRIRWAASVYGKAIPELRASAEKILREIVEPDAVLRGVSGNGEVRGREVHIAELRVEEVTAWSDGSRQEEVAAAAYWLGFDEFTPLDMILERGLVEEGTEGDLEIEGEDDDD
ncbi:hypothetical protein EV426DRAFT_722116 [Tirmania nivea]|nr:hypothetical protein EV426DRAFT_722116 [Tirmania nivea]